MDEETARWILLRLGTRQRSLRSRLGTRWGAKVSGFAMPPASLATTTRFGASTLHATTSRCTSCRTEEGILRRSASRCLLTSGSARIR